MRIDFLTAEYKNSQNINEELTGVLQAFKNALECRGISQKHFVRLTVFYNPGYSDNCLSIIKKWINSYFTENIPTSYIAQPPQKGQTVILEAGYVNEDNVKVEYFKLDNICYAKAEINFEEHLFISGLQSCDTDLNVQAHSEYSFKMLERILEKEGYSFSDIIRQWNYIEHIVDHKWGDQNYQIFNDVRSQFYYKNGLKERYPAATGIGIKEGGVIIEVHALKGRGGLQLAEIANPLQVDAFNYSEKVLDGKPLKGLPGKTTPKFSRAKLLVNAKHAQIMLSGTASIIGEDTIGLNNVEEQTKYTIQNIFKIIEPERLGAFNSSCGNAAQEFSCLRVYIKEQKDFDKVKGICGENFKTSNIIYIQADVCRENLLVEIEGVVSLSLAACGDLVFTG